MSDPNQLTIGQLAKAAAVGVETIRYYQRRGLLPVPLVASGFRTYTKAYVARIRFIKRAQELGFHLDEVAQLLALEDSHDRTAVRDIAAERLLQVRAKLADLQCMEQILAGLIARCAACGDDMSCPIIDALSGTSMPP
ncbi:MULTISPECIES: MerR family transcriptional regulator [unclassified Undibacterium]|uniref:MerR family transcriptional regulator n=1 Tax=unclassified Undibacterium TaxID=2630295 RepID=UPI002AC9CD5E|nr:MULTISPECIES: MerR family transcriptional regulator [unclassified Undibacterium]MEB0140284.1 MerR family transcriptional regulator [Undibacterium sp. CCC2.1]MEB0173302.1 MerR family transcriptional regulator [Undibacterium sp. CCC1.1]MEB0177121.1 MerR family transcriptional regulator [Undibacterium sp. CCC3.4]MEB0216423.1 MerR family transcriptional regulator [Undibacterium sp. 5I2]WPX45523.1 MerR family transcriptional regulator [Undibacterium sp. CCC3.4]